MSFDFLPELPKPNLDDRTFNDLVEECKLRIPRYCPEWTNYNPSDPGITFIELFAWLTDQMLYRFNQVPYRLYIVFLELLGIRLQPPVPATTELTFYLTREQSQALTIPLGTEVATLRTETEEAIVFTIDRPLVIGRPQLRHLLTADIAELNPTTLRDRTPAATRWNNLEELPLFEQSPPRPDNCFYVVLDDQQAIAGTVLAFNFRGRAATTTGIDPDNPPLCWEAWNGHTWRPVLRQRDDDRTRGFSFSELGETATNSNTEGADVILHLPQQLEATSFDTNYQGYWIRCRYTPLTNSQQPYSSSPEIVGLAVRSIGGTVKATQCVCIQEESLGISNGKPGQTFELQRKGILGEPSERMTKGERIQIKLSNGSTEDWTEVKDFADSRAEDAHYVLDSRNGSVQFGPLVREPARLKQQTWERSRIQFSHQFSRTGTNLDTLAVEQGSDRLEHQYGRIPPLGSEIIILSYRTGGGVKGNVQAGNLTVLKSAVPYVKSVVNYQDAHDGSDEESLEQAMIRVPSLLRTRESAVIPEDFERVAKQSSRAIARVHCIRKQETAGIVRLLVVPRGDVLQLDEQGMKPDACFALSSDLETTVLTYLQDRKPLGIQVKLQEPDYVGVQVKVPVVLDPQYNNATNQAQIRRTLSSALYRFLNPLVGGIHQLGWPLGVPVYPSDIIALCQNQKLAGVRYWGAIELFEIRKYDQGWFRSPQSVSVINPGVSGLVCSWDDQDTALQSGHEVTFSD
ncbi:MAG: putative baseplate assembly protein [Leptolyngbyaceae cyanobacterium CSU_1_3]|nr:putative baseplate assembly protein [Leptolyngbyaceae cyanobacterium CSU_1_3]